MARIEHTGNPMVAVHRATRRENERREARGRVVRLERGRISGPAAGAEITTRNGGQTQLPS